MTAKRKLNGLVFKVALNTTCEPAVNWAIKLQPKLETGCLPSGSLHEKVSFITIPISNWNGAYFQQIWYTLQVPQRAVHFQDPILTAASSKPSSSGLKRSKSLSATDSLRAEGLPIVTHSTDLGSFSVEVQADLQQAITGR